MWRRRNPRPASQSSQYCECRSGRGAKIPPPAGGRSIGGLRPPFFTSRTPTRSVGCGIARRMGKSRARHVAVRSIITSPPCAPSGARPSPCRGGQIDSRSRDAPAPEFLQKPLQKVSPQRGGGAPTGAPSIGRTERMRQRAHRSPLASRRSTAALARQLNATAQPRPRFTRARGRRCYPRRHSRLSEAPRAPVVMPAGSMPGPPGSGVTSPARRNRTRPIARLSPVDALRWARFARM